ncbi:hypothetical protein EYR40_007126 [Pleurotus pulmonarius]|nr:hypothetical protein EYR36_003600 [Pleurotus pulmonarius]KAF4600020.1 hypothetical protein EYR40_007126 [Pleurotus pulmonarius]
MVRIPRYTALRATRSAPESPEILSRMTFEETLAQAEGTMRDMARETKGNWIGPCPAEDLFAGMSARTQPGTGSSTKFDTPETYYTDTSSSCENKFYEIIVKVMLDGAGDTTLFAGHSLVDASIYPDSISLDGTQTWHGASNYEKGVVSKESPSVLELVLLGYDMKTPDTSDIVDDTAQCSEPLPHDDCEAPYEIPEMTSTLIRGRLANHAAEICRRQHRTHLYMVYVFHPFIRFIRWDRSGAIISERVNYIEDCTPLVQFLLLFGRLDRAGKGFDPTVQIAPETEAGEAKKYLKRWAPRTDQPVFKMDVPSAKGRRTRKFLVWGAIADPESPFGRATRGYPGVEVVNGVVSATPTFLKEQWRDVASRPETETLQELNDKGVKHVPTLVCGGDLPGQETKTHEVNDSSWRIGHKRILKRIHSRFVVAELSMTHSKARHKQAYEKCGILHRDVSGGNILILDNNEGLLNDWDLARKEAEDDGGPRDSERTGTWQFMSFGLLRDPHKRHTARDDLESFFWVILYYGLHYMSHSLAKAIQGVLVDIFDKFSFTHPDGIARGGIAKVALVTSNVYIGRRSRPELVFTRCPPLTDFIFRAVSILRQWHGRYDPTIHGPTPDDNEEYVPATHADMEKTWDQALHSSLWPEGDRAIDQVRRTKIYDLIARGERPGWTDLKRSRLGELIDGEDEDGSPRKKRRKTCHRSEAAHL